MPENHPDRHIKPIVDPVLEALSSTFARMYAEIGRPSIPPENLLKGSLLISLFTVRRRVPAEDGCSSVSGSSMALRLRSGKALLFEWFLDLNVIDHAFDTTTFSHNKVGCFGTRWPGSSSTRCSREPTAPTRSWTVAGPPHG